MRHPTSSASNSSLLIVHEATGWRVSWVLVETPRPGGERWQVTDTSCNQGPAFLEVIKIFNHSHFEYYLEDKMPTSRTSWTLGGTDCTSPPRHHRCAEILNGKQDEPLPATIALLVRDSFAGCLCIRYPEAQLHQHPPKGCRLSPPGRCP